MEKYWPLAAMVLGLVQGQMPEGLMTDLNKLYYEGSQAYYDVGILILRVTSIYING